MPADTVTNGAGTVLLRAAKSPYIPEIITTGSTYAGPYVQIEGYGGDCVLTSMTCADSDTTWTGKTVGESVPIEGYFTAITITTGSLLAYRQRA